jgi:hypothetical protein
MRGTRIGCSFSGTVVRDQRPGDDLKIKSGRPRGVLLLRIITELQSMGNVGHNLCGNLARFLDEAIYIKDP